MLPIFKKRHKFSSSQNTDSRVFIKSLWYFYLLGKNYIKKKPLNEAREILDPSQLNLIIIIIIITFIY